MAGEWTTADYAFVVSLCSAGISLFSLGWNIWSKFIFPKPKVRVWADVRCAHLSSGHICTVSSDGTIAGGFPHAEMFAPAISIAATNFGPGAVTIDMAIGKVRWFHKVAERGHAVIMPYNNYPHDLGTKGFFSGGLPKKLDVGEEIILYFPISDDLIGSGNLGALGVRDSFSRMHWVSRRTMSTLKKQAAGFETVQP